MAKNNKIQLEIIGLSYSQTQTGAYALILGEKGRPRRLPVIIGTTEAQSIAIQLEGLSPSRPLTHDLFVSFAKEFEIEVQEVNIIRLEEGIFYSELVVTRNEKKSRIDARTSDAIAIALRFNCPIYCLPEIMDKAGLYLSKTDSGEITAPPFNPSNSNLDELTPEILTELSVADLKVIMDRALEEENYETASNIRDELNIRPAEDGNIVNNDDSPENK